MRNIYKAIRVSLVGFIFTLTACSPLKPGHSQWQNIAATGQPTARHEAAFAAYGQQLYLMGGRRINPTDVFDIATASWTQKSKPPVEIHHFQPVVKGDAIYIVGAMTGSWPHETPLDKVLVYYPKRDEYQFTHTIPEHRRRGGAGAVLHDGKIYIVGGIVNGHMNGYKPWLDRYDPTTGQWQTLDDAPNARDHFQAVVANNKLYALAGRTTSKATEQDMALTIAHGNVYDFAKAAWEPVTNTLKLPTLRAGNAAFNWGDNVVIVGGESDTQEPAFAETQAYNTTTQTWSRWANLKQGRHGTGVAIVDGYAYMASGAGKRGGGPELTSIERLALPPIQPHSAITSTQPPATRVVAPTPTIQQWHTHTLNFTGPDTSEQAQDNPFLNYRLRVDFTNGDTHIRIRGFYAADGKAAKTSATSGNIWQVKFTPPSMGQWKYQATLEHGNNIALANDDVQGTAIALEHPQGQFNVTRSDKEAPDFRAYGRLGIKDSQFYFAATERYWLKAGSNSPENLLAYQGFDGTYRLQASNREGEAKANTQLHQFTPHIQDWQTGDLVWKDGQGKGLVGLFNYLSAQGMNASYFLTMNINGDGNDVWPYTAPTQFERFDVSRLAQWEQLFQHMQAKGILLHLVTQETENERLLDDGDTGPLRQLYYREMIARFGHHLGLVWNLGEENGPAEWSPPAQNDAQRKAMAKFIKRNDPYKHPVLLHTHSEDLNRTDLLTALLGDEHLDGLSLQEADPTKTAHTIQAWKQKSQAAGHPWLITMDEIGPWYTGAASDQETPQHPALIKDVLWGSLLAGAAGIEWYFGAKTQENDLTAENLRLRHDLWQYTRIAHTFYTQHIPWWATTPAHAKVLSPTGALAAEQPGKLLVAFIPQTATAQTATTTLDLSHFNGTVSVQWFNPLSGGDLIDAGTLTPASNKPTEIPIPIKQLSAQGGVVLIKTIKD